MPDELDISKFLESLRWTVNRWTSEQLAEICRNSKFNRAVNKTARSGFNVSNDMLDKVTRSGLEETALYLQRALN